MIVETADLETAMNVCFEERADVVVRRSTSAKPVVLASEQPVTLAGLRASLVDEHSLTIVGEATNYRDALSVVRRLQPDLLILDVGTAYDDGIEAIRLVHESNPATKILILGMLDDADVLVSAIRAGAAGYVLQTSTMTELRRAIRRALAGELPVEAPHAGEVQAAAAAELTRRETEVLALLARGKTNAQIARALIITPHTVKVHVEHILNKLGVRDRTAAAVRAAELGYLRRPPQKP